MINNKNFLYKIDPKWKILLIFFIAICFFIFPNLYFSSLTLIIIIILYFLADISFQQMIKQLKPSFLFLLFILGFHFLSLNFILGIGVSIKFLVFILMGSLLTLTTNNIDLLESLNSLLKPLSYIGINHYKISLAFSLTICFIPLIIKIFSDVRIAQSARGANPNLLSIIIPTIIKILSMAENISDAIESRAYRD